MKSQRILEMIRAFLSSDKTRKKYRKNKKDFTRERELPFKKLVIITLTKSVKSLQNRLNEFWSKMTDSLYPPTASAYSQSRKKLKHEVFITMNEQCIIQEYYGDSDYKTFMGFRLVAVDGSKIYLPNSEDIKKEFGCVKIKNQHGEFGEYCAALSSIMYDPLNELVLDSILAPHAHSERKLALRHLEKTQKKDLDIYDRGYVSYELIVVHFIKGRHFVFRSSSTAFKVVEEFLLTDEIDKIVTIERPHWSKERTPITLNLPKQVTVRLVKVFLDSGETEVLITSLLDQQLYPPEIFKDLYWQRWGVETRYDIIKERLDLENFTGKTAESVKQDYYATIFISNLESILTEEANEILTEQSSENKNKVKVNNSISFNAIKNHALELLWDNRTPIDELFEKLTLLFLQTPTPIRKGRITPRNKTSSKSANYYKRRKKYTY